MFWTVLDFLQKPLAWFSKFYLRVQSKNCGRNVFFLFFFSEFFSEFERKTFRLSAKKLQEIVQTTFRVCGWTKFSLGIFLKCFEPFWIFCRNLWHGSQTSIFVSAVKIPEKIIFLFFFSYFFRSLSKRLSDFRPKNFKKLSKLPSAYADEQILAWEFFLKCFEPFWIFCRNLWHGSQNSIYVSRVKIAEEMVFFCFSFQNFFRILSKNFSDFWPKNFKKLTKLPSACSDEQFLAWNFFQKFWAVLDFLRKIWHGSQTSIFVSR